MGVLKSYNGKVAANGQVLIPKELRESLGLKGGDTIVFCAEMQRSGLLQVVLRRPSLSFKAMVGACKDLAGRPISETLDEINQEEMR